MKQNYIILAITLAVALSGCSRGSSPQPQVREQYQGSSSGSGYQNNAPSDSGSSQNTEITEDQALSIALENAGISEDDAYSIRTEWDRDNGISLYDVEFDTDYGDYSYEISADGGRIMDISFEVNERWLRSADGAPVTEDEAKAIVQSNVPGSSTEDIYIREDWDDGRSYYEGDLRYDGVMYEFEIDQNTGIITDWSADYR